MYGTDPPPPPIATDRPAVTDSSIVVPLGSLQAENGFAESVLQGQRTWDGPETLLRLGLASKTELRFTAPDYYGGVAGASGSGDLAIGLKQQLGPGYGFDASLVLSLSLPTGARGVSSHGYDPTAQLPWSRALSANWTAAGMLSVYWLTRHLRRNLTGETTFLLDRQLTKTWDAFFEYAGDFPQAGGTPASFALRHDIQTDAATAARYACGGGTVFRHSGSFHRVWLLLSFASCPAPALRASKAIQSV